MIRNVSRKSPVWNFFERVNSSEAVCMFCRKLMKCSGGSTSGLAAHIRNVHRHMIDVDKGRSGREKTPGNWPMEGFLGYQWDGVPCNQGPPGENTGGSCIATCPNKNNHPLGSVHNAQKLSKSGQKLAKNGKKIIKKWPKMATKLAKWPKI